MAGRSRHFTDTALVRAHGSPQRYTRKIQNWLNVPQIDGGWEEAAPTGLLSASRPPHWDGTFEFSHGASARAAQVWIRQRPRPLIGMRLSHRPDLWVNWRGLGEPVRDADLEEHAATWRDAWPGCDLRVELRAAGFEDLITIRERASARSFGWSLKIAPGLSVELDGGALVFRSRDDGIERLRTRPAYAFDAFGEAVDVVTTLDVSGSLPIVRYEVIPGELSQWPITLDPTTTISGTAAIEDVHLRSNQTTRNYGALTTMILQLDAFTGLVRFTSGYPAGVITDSRFYIALGASGSASIVLSAHAVKDANTWVEGVSNGVIETGACCWNFAKYNTQAWAGSTGCRTIGTDVDASPLVQISAAGVSGSYHNFALGAAIATAWRDATRVNNGIALYSNYAPGGLTYVATESANVNKPYFEIDYTTASGGIPIGLRQRRS